MTNYKKLYGVLDKSTGYLVGNSLYASNKYAYTNRKTCEKTFKRKLEMNPNYEIVELRPVRELKWQEL